MTGLMEPVGPEEPRTYWIRRAVVGGVVLVVVIAVIALIAALTGGDKGNTAEPPPPSRPTLQPAQTPTPTTSGSDATESGTPSTSPSDSSSGTSGSPSPSTKSSSSKKASPSAKPSGSSSSKPPAKPVACKPGDLRTTLAGPRTVTPGKKVTFRAGVINGGTTACTFTLDPDTYVFRIYSGTDKIWTTADCPKRLPKVATTLKPQADVSWKIEWTVQRSKGCDLVKTDLRPGTYAANSLVDGAKPAQVVMQLR